MRRWPRCRVRLQSPASDANNRNVAWATGDPMWTGDLALSSLIRVVLVSGVLCKLLGGIGALSAASHSGAALIHRDNRRSAADVRRVHRAQATGGTTSGGNAPRHARHEGRVRRDLRLRGGLIARRGAGPNEWTPAERARSCPARTTRMASASAGRGAMTVAETRLRVEQSAGRSLWLACGRTGDHFRRDVGVRRADRRPGLPRR
jgi:hypothetical protein